MARVAYVHNYGEAEEEKQQLWIAEEPEEQPPEDMTEEELKKRDEERAKKALEETEEITTVAKRKGYKLYIHGENFLKSDQLCVIFTCPADEEREAVTHSLNPIFKNSKLLALNIPDMGEGVPIGNHLLNIEYTLNGQQISSTGL